MCKIALRFCYWWCYYFHIGFPVLLDLQTRNYNKTRLIVCSIEFWSKQNRTCHFLNKFFFCLQMVLSKISLDRTASTVKKLARIRNEHFWLPNDHLTPQEQRDYFFKIKLSLLILTILWFFVFVLIVMAYTAPPYFTKFVYDEHWPHIPHKVAFSCCYCLYFAGGYYVGNTGLCHYAHVVLHNYFQMKILTTFMRKNDFDQLEVLKRCIRQYQTMKLFVFGNFFASFYNFFNFQIWKRVGDHTWHTYALALYEWHFSECCGALLYFICVYFVTKMSYICHVKCF